MYVNKIILAPMVRIGTLPMRLLALAYGADLVYTEELIDWKLLRSMRVENKLLGTVDYIDCSDGTVVFRTCPREKEKVILQMGTCDPDRALEVGKLVENDVAGIDINMGCPKEFSVKGGMGAALLSEPDKAEAIVTNLVKGVRVPVTCKVRVLEDEGSTIKLCQRLAASGISAIAIHGRTKEERPHHPNRNDTIRKVARLLPIPVIANGGSKEMESYEDILEFKELTGCESVMVARAVQWNASILRKEGKLPLETVIKEYLRFAVDYDNPPANTKYCVQNMLRELQDTPKGKTLLDAHTLQQICEVWELGDYCRDKSEVGVGRREVKRRKFDDGVLEFDVSYLRGLYAKDTDLPKTRLLTLSRQKSAEPPTYATIQEDKLFQSTVTFQGVKYRSTFWEKNKRWAEQGSAIVCLLYLGDADKEMLKKNGVLR